MVRLRRWLVPVLVLVFLAAAPLATAAPGQGAGTALGWFSGLWGRVWGWLGEGWVKAGPALDPAGWLTAGPALDPLGNKAGPELDPNGNPVPVPPQHGSVSFGGPGLDPAG